MLRTYQTLRIATGAGTISYVCCSALWTALKTPNKKLLCLRFLAVPSLKSWKDHFLPPQKAHLVCFLPQNKLHLAFTRGEDGGGHTHLLIAGVATKDETCQGVESLEATACQHQKRVLAHASCTRFLHTLLEHASCTCFLHTLLTNGSCTRFLHTLHTYTFEYNEEQGTQVNVLVDDLVVCFKCM
jgi:hypothetical protein